MSRIFYDGKLYDYPLKPSNALRNLGPVEAVRCVLSYLWVRIHPPKDQTTLEGWIAARFGWRLYQHFFKTYTEKVWGVPGDGDRRPTWARSASRTSRSCNAVIERAAARSGNQQATITSPHRGVQVPEVRPGDDVGGAAASWSRRRAAKVVDADAASSASTTTTAGPSRSTRRAPRRRAHRVPVRPRDLVDADLAARSQAMDPPVAGRGRARRPTTCATATSSPSRSSCPRQYGFPDNWIYIHDPDVEGRPHPELRLVVAVPGEGRPHLPRPRVLRERGRRDVDEVRRRPRRAGQARARAARPRRRRRKVEAGYVVRMPKAYPFYDEHYKDNVDAHARAGSRPARPTCTRSAATACTGTTTRTTRCTRRCSRSRTSSGAAPRRVGGQRRGGVPRGVRRRGRPTPGHRRAPAVMRR